MIQGTFSDKDELLFEIELIAANGLELPVDALLDTGFSGWSVINNQDLQALDWVFVRQRTMQLALGKADFYLYAGKVQIDGQKFDIPVHVGAEVPEVLIGRQWLRNRRLVVDIPGGVLTLG